MKTSLPNVATGNPYYVMLCPNGQYVAKSWLGLGWAILRHRMWHLWKDRKWMD
jgi:hypothetical protein